MDVSELFKMPALPKSALSNKRKAPSAPIMAAQDSEPAFKVARTDTNGKGKQRATVQDVTDEDEEELDYIPADNDFAPSGDADYFAEEDEGRFFGSGLTSEQKEILKIMDTDENVEESVMSVQDCRKSLLALERAVNKNRELRTKFPTDPAKFVDSEIALDAALGSLLLLTQIPIISYPEIVRLNVTASLIDLLAHENPDISISVIKLLEELTDEDVGEGEQDEDAFLSALDGLIAGLLENSLPELLISNISRFSPSEPSEQQGLYHSLGLIENLLSSAKATEAANEFLYKSGFLEYLLNAIPSPSSKSKNKENGETSEDVSGQESNRFYAAELLAILLSLPNVAEKSQAQFTKLGGMEMLLKCLSSYRKVDPKGDEVEYMENLFDCLCSVLSSERGKKAFRQDEGVELMVIIMKEKKMARTRSIKALDFAMSAEGEGADTCLLFVESLGLKTLFPAFMGKSGKKDNLTAEDIEHVLGILSTLLTALESDSAPRLRVLSKFVEESYEKVDRLLEIRENAENRIARWEADAKDRQEVEELDEDEKLLGKLENGLATLQLCDYILAWIVMEDDGIRDHASMLLKRQGQNWSNIATILQEYAASIGGDEGSEGANKRDITGHLVAYIQGLT